MMQTMDCHEARISLGVYVLGAIDPAERALVDAHLATCQECRDELVGLAGLPALLSRVSKEDALQLAAADVPPPADEPVAESAPPPELLGTVLDLTAARRRRKTWRNGLLGAAAAVIVAAGSFTGAHYLNPPAASSAGHNVGTATGPWESFTGSNGTGPRSGQQVTVEYQPMGWGTQLATKVVGLPVNTTCQLYIITKDNQSHLVSTWTTDYAENTVWYIGGTSIPQNDIKQFEVTTGPFNPVYITPSA